MKKTLENTDIAKLPGQTRFCVVVHYAEVGLKGSNRGLFENQLRKNILKALSHTTPGSVKRVFGRIIIYLPNDFDWQDIKVRLSNVFGIANFSLALLTKQKEEDITACALWMMKQLNFKSFRVTTKRAQKDFSLTSTELSARVGGAIQVQSGASVNLKHPEITCFIEIYNKDALVYSDRIMGLGGLPVGVSEKAISLLSSGIDSPVASWKLIKRGVRLSFIHFHSVPATTPASIKNAERLTQLLTRYQYKSRLYLIPLLPIQQQIMMGAPSNYRVLLYRRSMFRLAEMIALLEKASALVSGESVGQVASQTLSNIRAINDVVTLPVLRPLAGDDKKEIIQLAQKIGSFEISTETDEDCCSLYVPRHPETKADLQKIREVENKLNLQPLYDAALKDCEVKKFYSPEDNPGIISEKE